MQAFANNKGVAFGDVNLSEEQIRGSHNPGQGGWPTIRYFNKETGTAGASYKQKTNSKICDELGDEDNMRAYVEEYAGVSLCSADTGDGCGERELRFLEKMKEKDQAELARQLARLKGMSASSMKPDLKEWMTKRIAILSQLVTDEL